MRKERIDRAVESAGDGHEFGDRERATPGQSPSQRGIRHAGAFHQVGYVDPRPGHDSLHAFRNIRVNLFHTAHHMVRLDLLQPRTEH